MLMGTAKKKKVEEAEPWKTSTSTGHITNLKQSILETFDIYGPPPTKWANKMVQHIPF
jgi:hypothetical protein